MRAREAQDSDRPRRLGIIGGVGPNASANFYLSLVEECRRRAGDHYPELVMHSVALTGELEQAFVAGTFDARHEARARQLLEDSVALLRGCGVDGVVLLCNTLHTYLWEVLDGAGPPCLDLVRTTCEHVWLRGLRRVLLLATTATARSGLYPRFATRLGVEVTVPGEADQQVVSRVIAASLADPAQRAEGARTLESLLGRLVDDRTEAVVLGCTDLATLALDTGGLPVVDSLSCLVEASADFLGGLPVAPGRGPAARYSPVVG